MDEAARFAMEFEALYSAHFTRILRAITRLSGDADQAADLVQEAFIRLHRRGAIPDAPDAWLITVALNLLRNAATTRRRRSMLLSRERGAVAHSEPPTPPDERDDSERARRQVRTALDGLPIREQQLLLLRAEGYGYRELAAALSINPASVGVLLARAKTRFRALFEEAQRAP